VAARSAGAVRSVVTIFLGDSKGIENGLDLDLTSGLEPK
jgi:hypothetical protein